MVTLSLSLRGNMNTDFMVVLGTVADYDTGVAMAKLLVEEQLAACVQVLPGGTAVYRWQGELYVDPQVQVVIKTAAARWADLQVRWQALHTDEVPELLVLPVAAGLPAYLQWIDANTAATQDRK
jgi:periplasmic divalent cation tolerance protein